MVHNENGCQIDVSVEAKDGSCMICVDDNGEGVSDEQIEKLKTKIIEMQIKNWIKADTEFIKQVLNINERCD